MSRKTIGPLAVVVGLLVVGSMAVAVGRTMVYVDGRPLQAEAIVRNGVVYLPVRAVAEAIGLSVRWDKASGALHLQSGALKGAGAPGRTAAVAPASPAPASPEGASDAVYITKTGKKYHRAGCRSLSRSSIPIGRKDAQARGYTPCSVCKP
jgi:hypothetical protein